ncbi:MAG TPA: TetR/AcrR family transcriptional regulator [Pseudonocardiaceae bacterium]|jgi:AcrR family transcriptional regulator|nr:TetR/AcrR family transcriptional regulator [Pseudonocardiaceae bacterium]
MTGTQRRAQLLDVARTVLAERGFEATSVEEIAHRAGVSKPVVYEHFGGKDGIYAVVVDREMRRLLDRIDAALAGDAPLVDDAALAGELGGSRAEDHPHQLVTRAALAFLDYIEEYSDGFRILVRDSPAAGSAGTFSSLLGEIARQVEHVLRGQFALRGYRPELAALYSQALVGMVGLTGQWWLDVRTPDKAEVAAHLANLAWNGLAALSPDPMNRTTHA